MGVSKLNVYVLSRFTLWSNKMTKMLTFSPQIFAFHVFIKKTCSLIIINRKMIITYFCLFLGPTKLWFQDWNKSQASCTYGRIIRLFLKIGYLEKEKRNRWGDVWENSRGHEGAVDLTEDVWHHCRWYLQSRNFLRPGY